MGELQEMLGSWAWIVAALLILGIEIIVPSTFLLWPGLAALVVGVITLLLGVDSPIWPWQLQVLVFLVLSLVIAYFGKQYMRSRNWDKSEAEDLNERGSQLIGKTAIVSEAIVNGSGRVRLGDTTWRVHGDDAKVGAKVRVVSADAATLTVELDG